MTTEIKYFIEDNIGLLDSNNLIDLFHIAWSDLSVGQQRELINVLEDAGIETGPAREVVLRYALTMEFDVLLRPVSLQRFVAKNFYSKLGYDIPFVMEYIMQNQAEWDVTIRPNSSGVWFIYPEV